MNTKFKKALPYINISLVLIIFLQTCGVKSKLRQAKVNQENLMTKIDSLNENMFNNEDLIKAIQEVPAWETLRLEEICDKEGVSINLLKQKEGK